jgi:SET domain-containing protein
VLSSCNALHASCRWRTDVDAACRTIEPHASVHLQGAAFYTIQSCLNHANAPNCSCQKDIDDKDGCASVHATRRVRAGDELCISYVGDVKLLDEATLRASLADYGIPL